METDEIIVYEDNVTDIDFDYLIENDSDETIELMDTYFQNQKPTSKNEYTGLFESKNLIMLTAEAYSDVVIDKDRTPALYRLTKTGFVFNNYYQPDFYQSTTGSEFANMTGIISTWVDGSTPAFLASEYNYMPYGLGTLFTDLGYDVTAWHDGTYDYYYRDETHPNLGYTNYHGLGNGLDIEEIWPESDLEMMQATIDDIIAKSQDTGNPFHTYYMTISGHGGYDFDTNQMAIKNREVIGDLFEDDILNAYYSATMELEYALEYLLDALDDAGILDDTVIVMGADHYPYGLTDDQDEDYYAKVRGLDDNSIYADRYKNGLIIWSGSIENETIEIDTPCYSCDIVPTLLNLFGIEYDSRLLSGRDIFAPDVEVGKTSSNMHMAVFMNGSWITNAGKYDSLSGEFIPNDGVELENEDDYIEQVSTIASQRITFAEYLVKYDYYSHVTYD